MDVSETSFNRPIPGESLTAELGARPWQNPPQYSTVDEAMSYYIPRMAQDEFAKGLLNVMEMGVPLTVLANTIQIAGVMEGKHTVDVGILVMPAIIETMKLIGDSAGVEYNTGMDNESDSLPTDMARRVAADLSNREIEETPEELVSVEPEQQPIEQEVPPQGGLMSRRV
jgi:hypothetical protein